jgi:hypothetical protein
VMRMGGGSSHRLRSLTQGTGGLCHVGGWLHSHLSRFIVPFFQFRVGNPGAMGGGA